MSSALITKLERYTKLSPEDRAILRQVTSAHVRVFGPHEDVICEGDNPSEINLMLSGWACRHKSLEDGRRQIVAFFLPGDLCDHNVFILRAMDHTVTTLTTAQMAGLPRGIFERLMLDYPRVMQALWWESLVTSAIQREWTLNLGQRNATERMAHLFCEVYLRLESINHVDNGGFHFPLTQAELADVTGLSAVHVNRTLQELRNLGLIELKSKNLRIIDLPRMMQIAMFNTNYLHLDYEGRHLDAN